MEDWTIQKLLNWTTQYFTDKGIESPRLSAELLLANTLSMQRIELYTNFDQIVGKEKLDILHNLVKRAAKNEPVAYLLGKTEFYSLEIKVTPDCLIPRPETELLVERAVEFLRARSDTQLVCDLCTGSGCIAVAIAANVPTADIVATDISDKALQVAAENIEKHRLQQRVKLLCGDLFDAIAGGDGTVKFDLIVCNPPYVSSAEFDLLPPNVKNYEPASALYAGDDGLDVYRRITERVNNFLKPNGALILEIGCTQAQAVKKLLGDSFTEIKIVKDLYGNDRIVISINP